ncbi:MAG: NAD-binding protein, partial [Deltaproteobacteria bacterium]|nr:NAD-binding protein [Deltaproteobacteria bacterium]
MSKLINKVAVIGGGTLGSQIAMLASDAGYQVKIFDSRQNAFSESLQRLRSELQDK